MIRTQDMSKVYTTDEVETTALNSISVELPRGEFLANKGPYACRKTTLLHILGQPLHPPV